MNILRSEQGFTLIEVLVASTLTLGLGIVVMTLTIQAQQMSALMITKVQLNAEARLIFDMLGTGRAVDAPNSGIINVIEPSDEQIPGLRETVYESLATNLSPNGTGTYNDAGIFNQVDVTIGASTISLADDNPSNNNRLIITASNVAGKRMSSTVQNNVTCRSLGDPYFDCPDVPYNIEAHGYLSNLELDSSSINVVNKTINVAYTLVDPRLAGEQNQLYNHWDYRESYRTIFLMR